jgi:hypothetical protein
MGLRYFNIEGWETSAFITAMIVFVVLGFLVAHYFNLDFLPSFSISSFFTFLIFLLVSTITAIVLWCILWGLIIIMIIGYSDSS